MIVAAGPVMRIVKEQPPNIEAIRHAFPILTGRKGILFAYDPDIYNPDGIEIAPHLMHHERAHMIQQRAAGGPEKWWERYLVEREFRLSQEIEATVAEHIAFAYGSPPHNRRERAGHLDVVAERLSGGVYGYMIRRQEIKGIIKRAVLAKETENKAKGKSAGG